MTQFSSRAVRIDQTGGPEQLKLVDVMVGEPGPGEIRIRHKAVGLNFIDMYQRAGLYALPLPLQLGMEASGIIEAVGEGVTHLKVGDRAAYASNTPGDYRLLLIGSRDEVDATAASIRPTMALRDIAQMRSAA